MIFDAFASKITLTPRKNVSAQFLETGRSETVRKTWRVEEQKDIRLTLQEQRYDEWKNLAIPSSVDLQTLVSQMPSSWAIQFTFTLASPYLSKGIEAFDILDNPIIRDKVYEVPIVPASSWKGGLRAAAVAHVMKGEDFKSAQKDPRLIRLFGNDREEAAVFRAGRLHCFPTGFKATKCEVINPHERARRVGTIPILLECVPVGESGVFTVLYVPFGEVKADEVAADLTVTAQAIKSLLLDWGIGAKKSSGNGLAKDSITNLCIFPQQQSEQLREPQQPVFPEVCQFYEEQFGIDYQSVKPKDWKPHNGADFKGYKMAREAYQEYKSQMERYRREHAVWEEQSKQQPIPTVAVSGTLSGLTDLPELKKTLDILRGDAE